MERLQVNSTVRQKVERERLSLLAKIEDGLEIPMLILSFLWLFLMILEFTRGLSPFLESINWMIWSAFVVDFTIKFSLAPMKIAYIKTNLLTVGALLLPALRIFRVFRALRVLRLSAATRSLRLARVFTSMNRGISALGHSLGRRGFGYVLSLTGLVALAGAAGMYTFEHESGVFTDYGSALWWTAMVLTTMGSDYFPQTGEGRVLCLFLAVYGFAVFGYVTATVATFFVGRDAANKASEIASLSSIEELKREVQMLRAELQTEKQGQ